MDFDEVLEQWERRETKKRSAGKKNAPGRSSGNRRREENNASEEAVPGEPFDTDWLDLYPPNAEIVDGKAVEERPPTAGGRSIWLRRPHQDTLDLHGLSGKEAQAELARFVRSLRRRGLRKGMIIHGKGLHSAEGSILGPLVRSFLESSLDIGEFGHAARKDGGSGATWFILRQRSR